MNKLFTLLLLCALAFASCHTSTKNAPDLFHSNLVTQQQRDSIAFSDSVYKAHGAFIKRENIKIDSLNKIKKIEDKKAAQELTQWENTTKAGKIHKKHPDWSKEDCQKIVDGRIWIGMEYDMLLIERELPDHINTSNYGKGNEYQACWDDYRPSCFYFKADYIITSYN